MLDLDPPLALKPEDAYLILLQTRAPDFGSEAAQSADQALAGTIGGLGGDERLDLIALLWIGRGDFCWNQWREAREAARLVDADHAVAYVRHIPLAGDFLEQALSDLGYLLEDYLGPPLNATLH
jgi:hypothetical protein